MQPFHRLSQRRTTKAALRGALALIVSVVPAWSRDVTFFHTSDTQPDIPTTQELIDGTIRSMNALPGSTYPKDLGGMVAKPRGVIVTGDLTDNASQEQWDIFVHDWGLTGKDGMIHYPMYDGAGNHDGAVSTSAKGIVRRGIIDRNKKRVGVSNISSNGLHYSWDWDDVHFVCLNEYGGMEDDERYQGDAAHGRKRQSYGNPAQQSLQFLEQDLAAKVGSSQRPVILTQHYGFDDFVFHPWGNEAAWWTEPQALRLWDAIEGYNVIAILAGHNGSEASFDWLGITNQHMDDHIKYGVYHLDDEKMTMAIRDSKTDKWVQSWTRSTKVNASLPRELVQGPYLVGGAEAGTMTVCWRLTDNQTCTLMWGDNYFKFDGGKVEVKPYDEHNHLFKYTITNLKPGLSIQYALKIGNSYAPGLFYLPEAEGGKVKFLIADAPVDGTARESLFQTMYEKIYREPGYQSFIVDPGSLIPTTPDLSAWDTQLFSRKKEFRHIRQMLARAPIVSPMGADSAGKTLFPYRYQSCGAYAFDYRPVHVAVLSAQSGLADSSDQRKWLIEDLTASDSPCKMIVWRRSGNSANDQAFEDGLASICQTNDVDFVLSNGNAFYHTERNGTTFVTTAGELSKNGTLLGVTVDGAKVVCEELDVSGKRVSSFEWKVRK